VTGVAIQNPNPVSPSPALEVYLTLNSDLTPDAAVTGTIHAKQRQPVNSGFPDESTIYDRQGNTMFTIASHRLTDVGIGIAEPVWASDGVHADLSSAASGALRDFDGTGRLLARDITVQMRIVPDSMNRAGAALVYDVDPPAASLRPPDGLWLPVVIGALTPAANTAARNVPAYSARGDLREFLIPGSDSEIAPDKVIEFIFRVGDLYCARLTDPTDILSLAPWLIPIKDIKRQRGGVTILSNIIDPTKGEETVLNYTLDTAGSVTITVFNLLGDPVRVLYRARQAAGEYNISWDGRNLAGQAVARGVYFVKIVGPGIDETRKVLVVKQ
jgi:hypothetical protein